MKHRTIRKIRFIILLAVITIGTIITFILIRKENYHILIKVFLSIITVVLCFESLRELYKEYLTLTRKKCKKNQNLSKGELEIVRDAIKIIKSVNENIEIAKFSVYKVKHIGDGWFDYDEDTHELSIFIPFDKYLKINKDLCFMIVLHEILHSQNLRLNEDIFKRGFKEGINQFLTLWLIENYSKKYRIPECVPIFYFKFKTIEIKLNTKQKLYKTEVEQAKIVIQNSKQDIKKIFFNYINLKTEFFKSFVPKNFIK